MSVGMTIGWVRALDNDDREWAGCVRCGQGNGAGGSRVVWIPAHVDTRLRGNDGQVRGNDEGGSGLYCGWCQGYLKLCWGYIRLCLGLHKVVLGLHNETKPVEEG